MQGQLLYLKRLIIFTVGYLILLTKRVYLMSIFYSDYDKFAESKRIQFLSEKASKNEGCKWQRCKIQNLTL